MCKVSVCEDLPTSDANGLKLAKPGEAIDALGLELRQEDGRISLAHT